MTRVVRPFLLLLALLPALCGPVQAGPVTVRDGLGRSVVLPHRPVRIISLTPSVTEMLYALHLEDVIVGVTSNDDHPRSAADKPVVGDFRPNFERIVALHPDLVILEGRLAPTTLQELERLHLPALALDSATIAGFHTSVRLLGQATATSARAAALLAEVDRHLQAMDERLQSVPPSNRPRVFIEIWDQPLQTTGAGSFIDEVVRRAGGTNCFGDLTSGFPQVNIESLLVRNPDVIILTTSTVDIFERRPGVSNLKAVRSGRVFRIDPPDPIVRPGPRLADGLEMLYRIFYPHP